MHSDFSVTGARVGGAERDRTADLLNAIRSKSGSTFAVAMPVSISECARVGAVVPRISSSLQCAFGYIPPLQMTPVPLKEQPTGQYPQGHVPAVNAFAMSVT